MTVQTHARNASLTDLRDLLVEQRARQVDVVASATAIRSEGGLIRVKGAEQDITLEGVTQVDGVYRPTMVFDEGVAAKLGVPLAYVRRLRAERPDLYDANVNGWLHGRVKTTRRQSAETGEWMQLTETIHPADSRSFLLRCFRGDDGGEGIARAFLSDAYKVIDNLDALTAALAGVRDAGVETEISGCDLSDRRMYVRITVPEIAMLAPDLLRGYRSPFTGASADENPTVFAGIEISNSETGSGAFAITPRLMVQVCTNGMKITKDALRAVHLGGRLDDGVIDWSEDTQRKSIELVAAKTRDAVKTFLNVDYMRKVVNEATAMAGKEVPATGEVVKLVAKKLQFDQSTADGIFDHFVRGGQFTAGGVMQAATSFAQTLSDPDAAADLEGASLRILETAATS